MAGPTPVSALIHAATMVTAGVYMIARLNFLFSLSPTACGVVAFIGARTALFAATIGFFQYDIKKVLAYSTVSQLGFMFIGVGVGAYWAGVFHLMTHAFFKACLFLGSGSVIHGMHAVEHDEVAVQDMRNMGGLRRVMPTTARTYFIACLAITAAPIPFFAGFWSKDEILWRAFTTENTGFVPGSLVYLMGLVAAIGTSLLHVAELLPHLRGPARAEGDRQEGARVAARDHLRPRGPRAPLDGGGRRSSASRAHHRRRARRAAPRGVAHARALARGRAGALLRAPASASSSASWSSRVGGAVGAWALARAPLRREPLARLGRGGAEAARLHADPEQVLRRRDLPGQRRQVRSWRCGSSSPTWIRGSSTASSTASRRSRARCRGSTAPSTPTSSTAS